MTDELEKGNFGLPEAIDPSHEYAYRTGENGLYQYWYIDQAGNYWEYTNAPQDDIDYDPFSGNAFLVKEQVMPHTAPQYYTPEGIKLNLGVPQGAEFQENPKYNPLNPYQCWVGRYLSQSGEVRYVYADSVVRENVDLWVQQQLRVTDAGIPALRKYAADLFESGVAKDKVIGTILFLLDQAYFDIEDLIFAAVADLEFIDQTVSLLGRKFICDPPLKDFLISLTLDREPGDPLFFLESSQGKEPLGERHIASIFYGLKMNSKYLKYWHSSHLFSRIVQRLSLQDTPQEIVEEAALDELARVLSTVEDTKFLVDYKVRKKLLESYEEQGSVLQEEMEEEQAAAQGEGEEGEEDGAEGEEDSPDIQKSLIIARGDSLGVAQVWSDLRTRRTDEVGFSTWLHQEPMHEVSKLGNPDESKKA